MAQKMVEENALQFLKLGGSLITDKTRPQTPREDILERLATEIAGSLSNRPEMRLLLGHGSGSFGHVPAQDFGTRVGVSTNDEWTGFVEVWKQAAALNQLVMEALSQANILSIVFAPSASISANDGSVERWNIHPISDALQSGLLPVVFGDVVFDSTRGGTILSTEDLFSYLARQLKPSRIILAGLERGVWADYPKCEQLVEQITPKTFPIFKSALHGFQGADVTGGMLGKVEVSVNLVQDIPDLEIAIISGLESGAIENALNGQIDGTIIRNDP